MANRKYGVKIVMSGILIALMASCGPAQKGDTGQMEIEQTLQAVYAADTAQAMTKTEMAAQAPTGEPPVEEVVQPTAEEPAAEPLLIPGEPPSAERILEDADGSLRAEEKRALSGDRYLDNRYERSFTKGDMDYLPEVDIQTVEISADAVFYYFTIRMRGLDISTGSEAAAYGIEFDRSQNGRGDLLVLATEPQEEWSNDNLNVYVDKNGTVGGLKPMAAEAGMARDGYETVVEQAGDKTAFARIDPKELYSVQIAVSRELLGNPDEFLWGAWVDKGVKDPAKFDYNDAFGESEAGSPIKPSSDYPLKALHSLDNTCRLPYGFEALSGIPGICTSIPVVEKESRSCVCLEWIYLSNTRICAVQECH